MSTIKTNAILDASGGNTTTINGTTPTAYNTMGKNRIINGAMEIDQRNAGASVSTGNSNTYITDRFNIRTATGSGSTGQQSSTAPAGYYKSLVTTIGTGASPSASDLNWIYQGIEGLNVADLNWGTSNAKAITVSFWVRSSVTGTYAVSVANSSLNRSYVATYSVTSANTWEQKSVTIPGDTSGTWLTTNGLGIYLFFDLGCGSDRQGTADTWLGSWAIGTSSSVKLVQTSGATWYITGVQLEVGSVATEFERRPYGTELQLCQRYYEKVTTDAGGVVAIGHVVTSTIAVSCIQWSTVKRASPTVSTSGGTYARDAGGNSIAGSLNTEHSNPGLWQFNITVPSGLSAGNASQLRLTLGYYAASAEL